MLQRACIGGYWTTRTGSAFQHRYSSGSCVLIKSKLIFSSHARKLIYQQNVKMFRYLISHTVTILAIPTTTTSSITTSTTRFTTTTMPTLEPLFTPRWYKFAGKYPECIILVLYLNAVPLLLPRGSKTFNYFIQVQNITWVNWVLSVMCLKLCQN